MDGWLSMEFRTWHTLAVHRSSCHQCGSGGLVDVAQRMSKLKLSCMLCEESNTWNCLTLTAPTTPSKVNLAVGEPELSPRFNPFTVCTTRPPSTLRESPCPSCRLAEEQQSHDHGRRAPAHHEELRPPGHRVGLSEHFRSLS